MLSPCSTSPHGIYVVIVAMSDIMVNILLSVMFRF